MRNRKIAPAGKDLLMAMGLAVMVISTTRPLAAADFVAVASGVWDSPATWGGTVPLIDDALDTLTIPDLIRVTVPTGLGVHLEDGQVSNAGTLIIAGGVTCVDAYFSNRGHIIVDNGGFMVVGSDQVPALGVLDNDVGSADRGRLPPRDIPHNMLCISSLMMPSVR